MRASNIPVISSGDMSGNINGSPSLLDQIYTYSVQFVWTGTSPVGSVKLQTSNDFGTNLLGAGVANWTDVTGSTVAVSGNSGNTAVNMPDTGYRWCRAVYTFTSGVGTLNARANIKGV